MRRVLFAAALGLGLAVGLLALQFGRPTLAALDLLAPAASPLARWTDDPRMEPLTLGDGSGKLQADLHRPAGPPRAGYLIVHGLSPAGRRHPALVGLARTLARSGGAVVIPDLEGLRTFTLSPADLAAIKAGVRGLRNVVGSAPLAVLGLSFGAGPALMAAADPALAGEISLVGSLGGYYRLEHVIAFVTTGVHEHGGERYALPQEEYNRWKLLALLTPYVESARDRRRLGELAARTLADPGIDPSPFLAGLGPEGRRLWELVTNRDPARVPALLAALPARAREALEAFSPAGVLPRVRAPLLIGHGDHDPSIPYTESLKLAEAAPGGVHLTIFHGVAHTLPRTHPLFWLRALPEGAKLVALLDRLLDPSAWEG